LPEGQQFVEQSVGSSAQHFARELVVSVVADAGPCPDGEQSAEVVLYR
jgi:hypothetical protein